MAETLVGHPRSSIKRSMCSSLALLVWLGAMHFNFLIGLLVFFNFPSPWTVALLGFYLLLLIMPIDSNSPFGMRLAKFVCENAPQHFPIKFIVEDKDAFDPSRAYVLAAEPHSVLPIGIIALCNHTGHVPFTKIKALASSAVSLW
ncbi:hypothetical protein O6H91_Y134400 [Diphasiastrum complanatum]|nr:hypothetical protein O6H91_Y134400 [Diphasiastrum complanatum]